MQLSCRFELPPQSLLIWKKNVTFIKTRPGSRHVNLAVTLGVTQWPTLWKILATPLFQNFYILPFDFLIISYWDSISIQNSRVLFPFLSTPKGLSVMLNIFSHYCVTVISKSILKDTSAIIGKFHDGVIWLHLPEFISFFFSYLNFVIPEGCPKQKA